MINFTSMGCRKLTYQYENEGLRKSETPLKKRKDYYPFGLSFNQQTREDTQDQRYGFQGQEHQKDLDLGWVQFKWRMHNPSIGRFFNVDPLASDYVYNSPYAFSENHVTTHIELEGLEKYPIHPSKGLNNIAIGFQPYFRAIGKLVDNAGGKIKGFFSFGTEKSGGIGGVKGTISNETRTTITIGTDLEKYLTPSSVKENAPATNSPITLDVKTTNKTKSTVSGKVKAEGVDVHVKNVTSRDNDTGEVNNSTTVTVGVNQTGAFVKTGTGGTTVGLRTEHKLSAPSPVGTSDVFIKLGGEVSIGNK